jgi:glycosyltransferase involved in cell wall biosynthesis
LLSADAPGQAPVPGRVLLDVTFTLQHGGRSPVGLHRVEEAVLQVLRHSPGLDVQLVRHHARRGVYRPLTMPERDWLLARRTSREPAAPRMPPPRRRWRDKALDRLRGPCSPAAEVLICVANPWDYADPALFRAWRTAQGGRLVLVVHDLLAWEVPQLTTGREVRGYVADMLAVMAQADRLVAVSAHSAGCYAAAMAECGRQAAPVAVARPPIPPVLTQAKAGPLPAALDAAGRCFVLFCATIELRKNHGLLLTLWDRLRQTLPAGRLPCLVFVGHWGWGVEPLRHAVLRNWRLAPHVCVLEGVSDATLASLYRHALFTVFPSFAEGYGMPIAESLALGTPVVIADHPALHEAAEGLMPAIDPLDFAAWERTITGLLTDADQLDGLRQRARLFRGPLPDELGRAVAMAAAAEMQDP